MSKLKIHCIQFRKHETKRVKIMLNFTVLLAIQWYGAKNAKSSAISSFEYSNSSFKILLMGRMLKRKRNASF